ncbi:MAG: hypothetical protein H0U49_02340 [Parachlamydiaceae bacterium]|nr:hypothetical protein [Parachlamydiaceae bacterium]
MKQLMFVPLLLTLFGSLQAVNNQSSVYGTTNPTYAPQNTTVTNVPDIYGNAVQPQIQTNRGMPSQNVPYQQGPNQFPGYNSGQYQDPNNDRFRSDIRSNPGQYGQSSYIQGQAPQGTYYQRQNLQGTYNQNQYNNEIYQNQNLYDQYQRGQENLNRGMQYQYNTPSINSQMRNLEAMNEQNVNHQNTTVQLKSSSPDKYSNDKYSTENDREINLKIRKQITGWFTDNYKNIAIITNNGKTLIEGFVDNQDAKNTLQNDAQKIQPNTSLNVQVGQSSTR